MQNDHPIIDKPWEYRIVEFYYNCLTEDESDHFIDMKLKKGNEVKLLRFLAPKSLEIEKGFPYPTYGMEILDISKDGLENINVQVSDFESSYGSITFYAKSVVELPCVADTTLRSDN